MREKIRESIKKYFRSGFIRFLLFFVFISALVLMYLVGLNYISFCAMIQENTLNVMNNGSIAASSFEGYDIQGYVRVAMRFPISVVNDVNAVVPLSWGDLQDAMSLPLTAYLVATLVAIAVRFITLWSSGFTKAFNRYSIVSFLLIFLWESVFVWYTFGLIYNTGMFVYILKCAIIAALGLKNILFFNYKPRLMA